MHCSNARRGSGGEAGARRLRQWTQLWRRLLLRPLRFLKRFHNTRSALRQTHENFDPKYLRHCHGRVWDSDRRGVARPGSGAGRQRRHAIERRRRRDGQGYSKKVGEYRESGELMTSEHAGTPGHAGHMPPSGDRRALVLSGLLTGVYFVVELAIGLWSGSVAVTSDAFHTFSAVGGVLIALVAQRLSERPATWEHTFGWGRAEILGALFNGLFLVVMAIYVFWMGAKRLRQPIELSTGIMLWAAAGGIVTELISFRLLYQRQKGNLNLQGAFWHILQTFVGSLIIVVSALVIRFTGFLAIDPLLGMAFGLVLLWASWSILKSALRILLQATPDDLDLGAAVAALRTINGVSDVHHVHA